MIYACDHCHFLFSRMSPIERCPDCGKESIRPATPKEAQEFEGRKPFDRIVTLFIAMSLDGYVADSGGKVDWLQGENSGENDMAGYQAFIKDVDTVLMGWNTYHQVTTELSPGEWAYADLTSYVLTHRAIPSTDEVRFVSEDVCALVRRLKETQGKDIWVCGGPNIVQPLLREALIYRFHISIIPTLLGGGLRLFDTPGGACGLHLVRTEHYNGIVDLVYERREHHHGN